MGNISGWEEEARRLSEARQNPRQMEQQRRQRLKEMEDKRLAFAGEMARAGFAPERMLLLSTERGNLLGVCRDGGALCLIVGPELGAEDDFVLRRLEKPRVRREEVIEPATGLGGALGFGKRGGVGFTLILETPDGEWELPFIVRKSSCLICAPKRNPLLVSRRRRGDSNPAWELKPIEKRDLDRIEVWLDDFFRTI